MSRRQRAVRPDSNRSGWLCGGLPPLLIALGLLIGAVTLAAADEPKRVSRALSPFDRLDPAGLPMSERAFFLDRTFPAGLVWAYRSGNRVDSSVVISPDGRGLASATTGDAPIESSERVPPVFLWDTANLGKEPRHLSGHTRGIWGLAFSPDSRTLAGGCMDRTVRLWSLHDLDTTSVAPLPAGTTLEVSRGWVLSVAFSPDGKTLAAAGGLGDGQVWLWNIESNPPTLQTKLKGDGYLIRTVAFSPDGRLLAATDQARPGAGVGHSAVRLWQLGDGSPRALPSLETHSEGHIGAVAFSPSGDQLAMSAAASSGEPEGRLWHVAAGEAKELPIPEGLKLGKGALAYAPHGGWFAAAGTLTVRNEERGVEQTWPDVEASSIAFAPDGEHVAVTCRGAVYVLRIGDGK